MEKAVFGMIGAGGIAQSQHLPNCARAPHVRLKTLCDLRDDLLEQMRAKYAVPCATSDYRELLGDGEIDAVIVATREDAQARLTIEALEAGKHVYVEKPLASAAEQCRAVVEAQRAAGRFVAVGFNRRFAPAYRRARQIVADDGGARNIHYRISDDYAHGWGKSYAGGLRVVHEGCHVFDLLRWLAGSDVRSMYCLAGRDDDEVIVLQFASGCVASIMNSGYVKIDMPKERLEVVSDYGAVVVEEFVELRAFGYEGVEPLCRYEGHSHPDRDYSYRQIFGKVGAEALYAARRSALELKTKLARLEEMPESAERAELACYQQYHGDRAPLINYMVDKGWVAALDHFAECVLAGRKPENASAEDAWRASVLAHAAIESRQSGRIVSL